MGTQTRIAASTVIPTITTTAAIVTATRIIGSSTQQTQTSIIIATSGELVVIPAAGSHVLKARCLPPTTTTTEICVAIMSPFSQGLSTPPSPYLVLGDSPGYTYLPATSGVLHERYPSCFFPQR